MNYINLKLKPRTNKYFKVVFEVDSKRKLEEVAKDICAISSFGKIEADNKIVTKAKFNKLAPQVYKIEKKKKLIHIAYPYGLFEKNSITHYISILFGSLTKLDDVKKITVVDVEIPSVYAKTFQGPYYGVTGIRSLLQVYERAITACRVKNQFAMSMNQTIDEIKALWYRGVDVIIEDERLVDLSHNKFYTRVRKILQAQAMVEKETGTKKLYIFNVTGTPDQIFQRSDYIRKLGGYAIMVNVIATGVDNIQMLRKSNIGVMIYAHEGFNGVVTYADFVVLSPRVQLQLLRLSGTDFVDFGALHHYAKTTELKTKKGIKSIMEDKIQLPMVSEKFSKHLEVMPVFAIAEDDTLRTKVSEAVSHDITYTCI